MGSTVEQQEVEVATANTSKAARNPEPVAFDEGLNVPVVDDVTLRGNLAKAGGQDGMHTSRIPCLSDGAQVV